MIDWLAWLFELPFAYRNRVGRRFFAQDDSWVDDLVATVAQEHGLALQSSPIFRPWARGVVDGVPVTLEAWTIQQSGERVVLHFRAEIRAGTRIGFGARGALSAPATPTGDALFDEQVAVTGAHGAWFGRATRLAMERVVQHGGALAGGRLIVDTGGAEFVGAHEVSVVVRAAIDAARHLLADAGRAQDVASADPDPRVRVQALRHVLLGEPSVDWLRPLAADPVAEVAVVAAAALGEEGVPRLRALLTSEAAAAALVALGPQLSPGDADADRALATVLVKEPTRLVIELAGRIGSVALVAPLLRVAGTDKEAARAAVRAIQARVAGERGGVSMVAEHVGGEVSEADAPGGALSSVEPPPTR
jgi:hypothetical protein